MSDPGARLMGQIRVKTPPGGLGESELSCLSSGEARSVLMGSDPPTAVRRGGPHYRPSGHMSPVFLGVGRGGASSLATEQARPSDQAALSKFGPPSWRPMTRSGPHL